MLLALFFATMQKVNDFPNYHPLVVHFPIVLLLLAALMQIGAPFFRSKAYNYIVAALALFGFLTGILSATIFHAHPSHSISRDAMELFEAHEKFALLTLWFSGGAAILKIAALFYNHKRWLEVIILSLLLASGTTVAIAGHHGAALVYKQGIGPKGEQLEPEK